MKKKIQCDREISYEKIYMCCVSYWHILELQSHSQHGKLGMLYKNGSVLCNYSSVGELADIGNFVAC